jgi:nucleoside-diphosphate-sugar epimerase
MELPDSIRSEAELDDVLTRPNEQLCRAIESLSSPLIVLGASGKMGPSLCVLAQRASQAAGHRMRVIAVSRFSNSPTRAWLEDRGVQTLSCDLLDRRSVEKLPDSRSVVYLVGQKFGTQQNPSSTWAVNTLIPSYVAERYSRSRIVALSTGNVYPFVSVASGGATEADPPAPVGEYAAAALARERIFEFYSKKEKTPVVLLRLNYAVELRYGVLLDIALKVWHHQSIDLTTGYLNCIWQGDANDLILRSFHLSASPPGVFNLTGTSILSVRDLAQRFANLLGRPSRTIGTEAPTALLNNARCMCTRLGPPTTSLDRVLQWIAGWVMNNGATLGKPTHFEVRSGDF